MTKKLNQILFILVILVAIILRILLINSREIQYDDAFSILLSERSLSEIISGTAADTMPPFYYFILHIWMKVSSELWYLRTLSIVFSIGIIVLIYLIINYLFDQKAALWAAFFTAISPLQIYHAQDIRMYSLLGFCQLGYIYFFLRLREQPQKWGDWVWFILFGAVSLYTHNLAIFIFIIPDIIALIKRNWHFLFRLFIAQFVSVVLFSPWISMIPGQINKVQNAFWTPEPGIVEVIQSLLVTFSTLPLPVIWMGLCLFLVILISVILVKEVFLNLKNEKIVILALFSFLPPLFMFIVSYIMRPVYVTRGFITSTVVLYGLSAYILKQNWHKIIGKSIPVLFVACSIISLPFQYSYKSFPRSPYRELVNYLTNAASSNEIIIHDNKLSYFPSRYYSKDINQVFLGDEPGSSNDTLSEGSQIAMNQFPKKDIIQAVDGYDTVYFIYFDDVKLEYEKIGYDKHPNIGKLEQKYSLIDKKSFNDINVLKYVIKKNK